MDKANNIPIKESQKVEFKASYKEIGLIERYGSGIKCIMDICKDYCVRQPMFEEISNGFHVVLFKEKSNVSEKVTENQQKIIENIILNITKNLSVKTAPVTNEQLTMTTNNH